MLLYQFLFSLCVCINFNALIYVSAKVKFNETDCEYEKGNRITLPAYVIASNAHLVNNSIKCEKELRDFRNAIDHRILWSLKMLDSSGGYKPGFLYGNNYWLGSRSQCLDTMNTIPFEIATKYIINNTKYRDLQEEFPPFKVNYFIAHFKHNSTLQYQIKFPNYFEDFITLGLCLPASCSINDLNLILEKIFQDRAFFINNLYSVDFKLVEIKNLKNDQQWLTIGLIFFICVLVLTFLIMIIGTIYDIFVHQKYLIVTEKSTTSITNTPDQLEIMPLRQESKIGQILMCFSIYTNSKIIYSTKLNADEITVIHGLKFLCMIWLIILHVGCFVWDFIDNKPLAWRFFSVIRVIINIGVPVDTYFFLSGFLVTYLYLKNKINKGNSMSNYKAKLNEFFFYIIKRFIRMTPAYMMMIGITQLNSAWYNKNSQFYIKYDTCTIYWWRTLLYINNLFELDTTCMIWNWYLATNMQYYIIAISLLILSTVYFYMAVIILSILLIGSIVITGHISYSYEFVLTYDELFRLVNVLYFPPWIRIGPFIIGIITGYIIRRISKELVLKKKTVILCWCFSSVSFIFVLFGLYKPHVSILYTAMYVALSRTLWAIGMSWIVIACFLKHGGFVKQLLSLKFMIPLSKLTYCVYLVNPFVIQLILLSSETSFHFEFLSIVTMSMEYLIISYVCAFILSLMAEVPYILLIKMFFQSSNNRKYT